MPLSSVDIAMMNGGFQGAAMQQQAYAQMLGAMGPRPYGGNYPAAMQADGIMGRGMNMAAGVGAPLAMGALGLMGWDPLSLGIKAGSAAFGTGGIAGAVGAGALAFGGASAVMSGAQYVGSQVWAGAQQQQYLNSALRNNFNFVGPNRQGFSGSQMSLIGSEMRHMTHQYGPAGEVTGMEELTRLAANMGRMGMATGVRDAQEFSRKFKEMVTTLKSVATEMGTSLEAAQEMLVSMKHSGIFRKADQLRMASSMKGFSAAGNLSMSQLSAMGNIGSQIARSVGGLGKQGTFGGMLTLARVGAAQEAGIFSEEDIYNATGLSGAEGMQAFAQAQMSENAEWLRGRQGRRFLASIAGKDGKLNGAALQEWMAGGMSTGRTMQLANQNLAGIGRWNFVRNEGRLRGAALELGLPVKAMAYQQWLAQRGWDPSSMGDREMLAFQRFSGMGRDEAELALKEVQHLPEIMQHMKTAQSDQQYFDKLSSYNKTHGIEGIKNRFAQAKEKVNGALQQIGSEMFSDGSNMVEGFFNRLLGVYEQTYSKKAADAWQAAKMGGASGRAAYAKYFGSGAAGIQSRTAASALFGGGGATSLDMFRKGSFAGTTRIDQMGAGARMMSYLLHGESALEKFNKAGYHFSDDEITSNSSFETRMAQIQSISEAASGPLNDKYMALGKGADWISEASASGKIAGRGQDRLASFENVLMLHGNAAQRTAWMNAKSPEEKTRLMVSMYAGAMGQDSAAIEAKNMSMPEMDGLLGGKFATARDREEAYLKAFTGQGTGMGTAGRVAIGAGAGLLTGGLGLVLAGGAAGFGSSLFGREDRDVSRQMASLLSGDYGMDRLSGLFSSDSKTRDDMRKKVQAEMHELRSKDDPSNEDKAKLKVLNMSLAAEKYDELLTKGKGQISDADLSALENEYGLSKEQLETVRKGAYGVIGERQREARKQVWQREGADAKASLKTLQDIGLAKLEGGSVSLTSATKDKLKGVGGGAEFAQKMINAQQLMERASREGAAGHEAEASKLQDQAMQWYQDANGSLYGMSVANQRALASVAAGTDLGDQAAYAAAVHDRANRFLGQRGAGGAVAGLLGLNGDDAKGLKTGTVEDRKKSAYMLARKLGIDPNANSAVMKDLQDALGEMDLASKGKDRETHTGTAARLLQGVTGSQAYKDAENKRREDMVHAAAGKDPVVAALEGLPGKLRSALDGMKVVTSTTNPEGGGSHHARDSDAR